jgi:iron complex outermembrane receptor protein
MDGPDYSQPAPHRLIVKDPHRIRDREQSLRTHRRARYLTFIENGINFQISSELDIRSEANKKGGRMKKVALSTGVSIAALAWAQCANSQVQQSEPGAGAAEAAGGLEEITVTAQRRGENQQLVPIAITAVSARELAARGVLGTESLGTTIPSLQFSRQTGNGGTPFLRGVGSTNAVSGAESPVALYIDDVYVGAANATLLQFNNIDGIEVLKGPQGTLFGRNATGGVINIHTRAPSHVTSMDAIAGQGSFDTTYGSLYATTGLSDTIAANLAMTGSDQRDGYGRSLATGQDIYKGWNYGLRSQLSWDPTTSTAILFSGDYSRDWSDAGMNPVFAPGSVALGGGTNVGRFTAYANPPDYTRNTVWGLSAKVTQDLNFARLVSISGYRGTNQYLSLDADGSLPGNPAIIQAIVPASTRTASQELQLLSPEGGDFHWVAGAFYYFANSQYGPDALFTGTAFTPFGGKQLTSTKQIVNSYAGFAEGSYNILPATKVTLGLRYTKDDYDFTAFRQNAAGAILAPGSEDASKSFSKLTYRAILDQRITEDILVYGSYSRGFHSGGYPTSAPFVTVAGVPTAAPPVAPEVLDAYELGLKSELFDHKVRFNTSAFFYNYNDLQVTSIQNSTSVTLNAAKAHIKGLDADLTVAPARNLEVVVGASFLDSKFVDFPNGPLFIPNPASCATLQTTGPRTGGNTTCIANLSGNYTSRAPKFSGNVSATYSVPTARGDFSGNVALYHSAQFYWEVDNRYPQPVQNLLSAALSWKSPGGQLGFRVYGRNLLNNYYYTYFSESTGRDSGSPAMPRSFGGEVQFHF